MGDWLAEWRLRRAQSRAVRAIRALRVASARVRGVQPGYASGSIITNCHLDLRAMPRPKDPSLPLVAHNIHFESAEPAPAGAPRIWEN